jgi:large subunit ribosomal protein L18
MKNKVTKRNTRHLRIRRKVIGSTAAPRLTVFRSNQHLYAQVIDDSKHHTVASASTLGLSKMSKDTSKKGDKAAAVGETLAKEAQKKHVKKVVFDRGGYRYHGRIKALADGARKGGLEF